MNSEPWCHHDQAAVVDGVCECGQRVDLRRCPGERGCSALYEQPATTAAVTVNYQRRTVDADGLDRIEHRAAATSDLGYALAWACPFCGGIAAVRR